MIRKEEVYKIGIFNKPHGIHGELSFTFTDDIFDRVEAEYLICLLDGIALVGKIVDVYRYYGYATQVLAASIRHTAHIIQCIEVGADVATCPLSAIKGLLNHPLTDAGLKKFLEDYKRVNG